MQGRVIMGVGIASFLFVMALIIGIQKQEEALRLVQHLWQQGVNVIAPQQPQPSGGPVATSEPTRTPPPATPPQSTQPLPSGPQVTPAPLPSGALPSEAPSLVGVPEGLFGDRATVTRFGATGYSPEMIQTSILEYGVPLFAGDGAISWVRPKLQVNVVYPGEGANCTTMINGANTVGMRYEVFLPFWTPEGADSATIEWWNTSFTEAMLHERSHIELYEHYVDQINSQISAGDDCAAARQLYDKLFEEMNRTNCEFDLNEFGLAPGAELEDCTAFRG